MPPPGEMELQLLLVFIAVVPAQGIHRSNAWRTPRHVCWEYRAAAESFPCASRLVARRKKGRHPEKCKFFFIRKSP